MNRRFVVMALAVMALAGGFVAVRMITHRGISASAKAVYYCPMHPAYTSDRPGDCPICNMRLIKRESATEPVKDICAMHNCPKAHEGGPCPMMVVAKAGEAVTCPICGTHVLDAKTPQSRKILYWTDPMLPGYKSDKPGKSPMGMELIPVYEEAAPAGAGPTAPEGYTPILVSPQKQQLIGVKTAPVTRRAMQKTVRTVGRIAYDPELYQAEQEYLQAVRALKQAQGGMNPEVAEQAKHVVEASRMRLRLLGLGDALIEEMNGWEGPDQRLLVADPEGRVWLYAPIYEFESSLVKVGQTVTVELQAVPGKVLEGTIQAIDAVLDPATRSARARAVLTDPDKMLKPEMFVNASIVVPLAEVLAIPEEAVFSTGTRQIVFVAKGDGLFEPREVSLGVKADGDYEVKAGLAEGEPVVTSGNFLIDSESRLKAALEGMGRGQ